MAAPQSPSGPNAFQAKVSIALATYNGERFLAQQLESYLQQGRPPAQLIVSDDSSTDGTVRVAEEFAACAPFEVRILRHAERLGFRRNFAAAIEACTCDYVCLSDQDDVWRPEHVGRLAGVLDADRSNIAVISDSVCTDSKLHPTGSTLFDVQGLRAKRIGQLNRLRRCQLESLAKAVIAPGHAMAFRRSLTPIALPFPDTWYHDQWIAICAVAAGKLTYLSDTLTLYRGHEQQAVGANDPEKSLVQWARESGMQDSAGVRADAPGWEDVVVRIEKHLQGLPNGEAALATALEKLAFVHRRAAIREAPLARRLVGATGELARGRYHRLARGLLAYGRDVYGTRTRRA